MNLQHHLTSMGSVRTILHKNFKMSKGADRCIHLGYLTNTGDSHFNTRQCLESNTELIPHPLQLLDLALWLLALFLCQGVCWSAVSSTIYQFVEHIPRECFGVAFRAWERIYKIYMGLLENTVEIKWSFIPVLLLLLLLFIHLFDKYMSKTNEGYSTEVIMLYLGYLKQ
jgi:hypothetical protein